MGNVLLLALCACLYHDMAVVYGRTERPYALYFQVCLPPGPRHGSPVVDDNEGMSNEECDSDSSAPASGIVELHKRRTRGVVRGHGLPELCLPMLGTRGRDAFVEAIRLLVGLPATDDVEELVLDHIVMFYNRYHVHDCTGRVYSLCGLLPIAHVESPSATWNALVRHTSRLTKVRVCVIMAVDMGVNMAVDMAIRYGHIKQPYRRFFDL